jgi:hypothetical protein
MEYNGEEKNPRRTCIGAHLPGKFKIPLVLYYTLEMSVSDIAAGIKFA